MKPCHGYFIDKIQKAIKELQWKLIDLKNRAKPDVLVAHNLKRTIKLLVCINYKIPIVTEDWLLECRKTAKYVDTAAYLQTGLIEGKIAKHNIDKSIGTANPQIFKGKVFYLHESLIPKPDLIKFLIWSGNGTLSDKPKKYIMNIIENDDNNELKKENYSCYSKDIIFEGILNGILDEEKYKI